MKKNYMKPTMRVVKIQQQQIICTSPLNSILADDQDWIWDEEGGQ